MTLNDLGQAFKVTIYEYEKPMYMNLCEQMGLKPPVCVLFDTQMAVMRVVKSVLEVWS